MIHLPYLGTSSVILRLTKVATILNPYYTFEIINQQSKEVTIFTADNQSQVPLVYDEFEFASTTGAPGLTQGIIDNLPGVYTYNVYETEFQYNLNLASASFIRSGELVISDTNDFTYSFFTQSDDDVTPVFDIKDY